MAEIERLINIAATLAACLGALAAFVKTLQNGRRIIATGTKVDDLYGLINGRLSQLLKRTEELGTAQAELAHERGKAAGRDAGCAAVETARVHARVILAEASAQAKRLLAEAATEAKEQIDLVKIKDECCPPAPPPPADPPAGTDPPWKISNGLG